MEEYERLYRALAATRLEAKLAEAGQPAAERAFIERELRRRDAAARTAGALRRKPRYRDRREPKWWDRRRYGWPVVYGLPLVAMSVWSYVSWNRYLEYRGFEHHNALELTLTGLHMPLTGGGLLIGLPTLLLMAAYVFRPNLATAIVSLGATAWWCLWGIVLLGAHF